MTSSPSGRRYQISVALPEGYTKEHPAYPVLYAGDANAEFGTVVETARLLSFSKEIPDLVIVGIGYPNRGQGFKASNAERTLDFTPTADPAWVKESVKDFPGPRDPSRGGERRSSGISELHPQRVSPVRRTNL